MRVAEDLIVGVNRAARHFCCVELCHPVCRGLGRQHRFDFLFELVDVLEARGEVRETRVGQPLRFAAHHGAEVVPELAVVRADGDVAVFGLVRLIRRRAPMARARRGRQFPAAEIGAGLPEGPREPCLEQRSFKILALARLEFADIRAEDAVERGDSARDVVHRNAHLGRTASRITGHHHDARHALSDDVEAALAAVRAGLAEAGHRGVDHAGIEPADRVVVDAEFPHHARAEVLRDDVGIRGELHENLLAASVLHVEGDALLVAVEHRETVGLAVHLGIEAA